MDKSTDRITCFVTGATGLVGSYICKILSDNNFEVIALVRKKSSQNLINWLLELDVKLNYGDLLDASSYYSALQRSNIVIHTAASVLVKDKKINYEVNSSGTRCLLDTMKKYDVNNLIHISTVGVYGRVSNEPVVESRELNPQSHYSKSKLKAEQLIIGQNNINYIILRPPFIFGYRDRNLVPTLKKLLKHKFIPKIRNQDPKFGFVHAEDIADAVLLIIQNNKFVNKVFNIQSFDMNYSKLISACQKKLSLNLKIIQLPKILIYFLISPFYLLKLVSSQANSIISAVDKLDKNWTFSTKKIREELNWYPKHIIPDELEIYIS